MLPREVLKRIRKIEIVTERLVRDRSECDLAAIDVALVANPPAGALQGLSSLWLVQ